jgi:hypothetical protein
VGGDAQPRVPAGNPKGGEFASSHGASATRRKKIGTGMWGATHEGSQQITGEAANMMGIDGFKRLPTGDKHTDRHAVSQAKAFLTEIAGDHVGSPESLSHGFARTLHAQVGDTLKIPTTATAGMGSYGVRPAEGWATGIHSGTPKGGTILVFAKGTPMAGYQRNSKEFHAEQGHWGEAIVAGHFRVTKITQHEAFAGWHQDPKTFEHHEIKVPIRVIHLENIGVFDPVTGKWHHRG